MKLPKTVELRVLIHTQITMTFDKQTEPRIPYVSHLHEASWVTS